MQVIQEGMKQATLVPFRCSRGCLARSRLRSSWPRRATRTRRRTRALPRCRRAWLRKVRGSTSYFCAQQYDFTKPSSLSITQSWLLDGSASQHVIQYGLSGSSCLHPSEKNSS